MCPRHKTFFPWETRYCGDVSFEYLPLVVSARQRLVRTVPSAGCFKSRGKRCTPIGTLNFTSFDLSVAGTYMNLPVSKKAKCKETSCDDLLLSHRLMMDLGRLGPCHPAERQAIHKTPAYPCLRQSQDFLPHNGVSLDTTLQSPMLPFQFVILVMRTQIQLSMDPTAQENMFL